MVQNFDIEAAIVELQEISGLTSDVEIKKIINEVNETPDQNNHKIIKEIKKSKADNEKNFESQLKKQQTSMTKKLDLA